MLIHLDKQNYVVHILCEMFVDCLLGIALGGKAHPLAIGVQVDHKVKVCVILQVGDEARQEHALVVKTWNCGRAGQLDGIFSEISYFKPREATA